MDIYFQASLKSLELFVERYRVGDDSFSNVPSLTRRFIHSLTCPIVTFNSFAILGASSRSSNVLTVAKSCSSGGMLELSASLEVSRSLYRALNCIPLIQIVRVNSRRLNAHALSREQLIAHQR